MSIKSNREKLQKLFEKEQNKPKCKTYSDNDKKGPKSSSYHEVKQNLSSFKDYMNNLRDTYFQNFKSNNSETFTDFFDLKKEFEKAFPYISRTKKIDKNSIQFPSRQYFLKNLFNDIIDTLSDNKPYPLKNKYGLTYINDNEWIYFTIEEMNYQKYISDSKKMYSFLYDDYMNKVINEKEFFTENDKYILPSTIRGLNFERNAYKLLQIKTNLNSAPDLLIKLSYNKGIKIPDSDKINFKHYIRNIEYNYMEIDGCFINDTKKIVQINNEDIPIIFYPDLIIKQIKNSKEETYCCEINENNTINEKIIKIPPNSVIIIQTKTESPTIKLKTESDKQFDNIYLTLNEMKKELAVVLYKMIFTGNYFFRLYNQLKIIEKSYSVIYYLIFDNYPIKDISTKIKEYIDIFIKQNYINYSFQIQPIYMNTYIEQINSKLESKNIKKEVEELKKTIKEMRKEERKRKEEEERKRKEEEERKRKEEEERKRKEEEERKRKRKEEEERKRKEEEERKRKEEEEKKKEKKKMKTEEKEKKN